MFLFFKKYIKWNNYYKNKFYFIAQIKLMLRNSSTFLSKGLSFKQKVRTKKVKIKSKQRASQQYKDIFILLDTWQKRKGYYNIYYFWSYVFFFLLQIYMNLNSWGLSFKGSFSIYHTNLVEFAYFYLLLIFFYKKKRKH